MKNLLTISIVLFAFISYGQDTTYFDSNSKKVKSLNESHYYQISSTTNGNKQQALKTFFKSGKVRSEYQPNKKANYYIEWYENGQLRRADTTNSKGEQIGRVLSFWENGAKKRVDIFEKGKLIKGSCYDINGNEIMHTDYQVKPCFPGGEKNMMQYIGQETRYPIKCVEQGIQGTALVNFIVGTDGQISEIGLEDDVDYDLGIEALRVAIKMPRWTPGLREGEPINVRYIMPVKFLLFQEKNIKL